MTDPSSTSVQPPTRSRPIRRRVSGIIGWALGALVVVSALALAVGMLAGSNGALESQSSGAAGSAAEDVAADSAGGSADAVRAVQDAGSKVAVAPAGIALADRAVIRTAAISLLSDNVAAARSDLLAVTASLGGYVADEQSEASRGGRLRSTTLTVQVPTADLDVALERMARAGTEIARSQSTQDVTEQVVDVDSRVNSAQAALRRVRLLLKEANSLGDVIRLEQVLSSRQADLESLLSQQESLAARTSMATLRVDVSEPMTEPSDPDEDDDSGFLAGLARGWDALGAGYVALATLAGMLLPTAVVLALIALAVRLVMRRGRWGRSRAAGSTA